MRLSHKSLKIMWREKKDWFPRTARFRYCLSGGGGCIDGIFFTQNELKAGATFNIFSCNGNAVVIDVAYE